MKHSQSVIRALLLASLLLVRPALAHHVAIVYCGVDKNREVRVVAADTDMAGEIGSAGKKWRSCSQVLHEIMSRGYEISYTNVISHVPTVQEVANQHTDEITTQQKRTYDMQRRSTFESEEWGYIVFVLNKTEVHK